MPRNILKERRQSRILAPITIIVTLYAITMMYYFVVMLFSKNQGGLNIYISGILAGATGGLWSLGINIGYKHFRWTKYCSDSEWINRWNSQGSFRNFLLTLSIINAIFIVLIIFLLYSIEFFELY